MSEGPSKYGKRLYLRGMLVSVVALFLVSACGMAEEPSLISAPIQTVPGEDPSGQGNVPLGERSFGAYFEGGAWNHADQKGRTRAHHRSQIRYGFVVHLVRGPF